MVSYSLLAFLRAQSGVSMVASRKNERKVTSVLFHSSTQIGRFLCRFRWCDKYTQSFYVQIHVKRTSQNKSHAQKKASSLSALCSALTSLTTLIVGEYGTIYQEKDICKHILQQDDQISVYFMLNLCICNECTYSTFEHYFASGYA